LISLFLSIQLYAVGERGFFLQVIVEGGITGGGLERTPEIIMGSRMICSSINTFNGT
jgi:hypothetical protein